MYLVTLFNYFVLTVTILNPDINGEGIKPDQEMPVAEENHESSDALLQERLHALEAIYSLSRTCGGDSSDGTQGQMERLSKAAEFFLEMGFFAPSDGGTWAFSPLVNRRCGSWHGAV